MCLQRNKIKCTGAGKKHVCSYEDVNIEKGRKLNKKYKWYQNKIHINDFIIVQH